MGGSRKQRRNADEAVRCVAHGHLQRTPGSRISDRKMTVSCATAGDDSSQGDSDEGAAQPATPFSGDAAISDKIQDVDSSIAGKVG